MLLAYGDLRDRFFSLDDFAVLARADQIPSIADLPQVFVPWPSFAQYRPLTTVGYFWLARRLFGLDPRWWMAVQLGAFALNALLVFVVARRLLGSGAAGLATALVYCSAPGHALAVRWIAFATIWGTVLVYFLALWTWVACERWRVPATLVLFGVALLCSEHAVTLPAALTVVAVLGQGRRDWRRLARELAPFWLVSFLYVTAKVFFVYVIHPAQDPVGSAMFRKGYALSFDGGVFLQTLGQYVTATLAPIYAPERSATWYVAASGVVLGLAVTAVVAALRGARRWVGVTACGFVLFVVGLGPVLLLPGHFYPAYIGIGALGVALAVIAPLSALRRGGVASLGLAAILVAVHLASTGATIRTEKDFVVIDDASLDAARWLATLDRVAGAGTNEVVVPLGPNTSRLFGAAHRMFLCAPYPVRLVGKIATITSAPGRVVVEKARGPIPSADGGWRAIRRDCPRDDGGSSPGVDATPPTGVQESPAAGPLHR